MVNPWIEHIRKYSKDNNISYACAVTKASATYTKKKDVVEKKIADVVVEKNIYKRQPKVTRSEVSEEYFKNRIKKVIVDNDNDPNQKKQTFEGLGYFQKPFKNESQRATENRNDAIHQWSIRENTHQYFGLDFDKKQDFFIKYGPIDPKTVGIKSNLKIKPVKKRGLLP